MAVKEKTQLKYKYLRVVCVCVFSGLEGASQTRAAKVEKHRCPDDQNNGADEKNARVCCS